MPDREKVINGLEHCICNNCDDVQWSKCEYSGHGCIDALLEDALALLKAQEPVKPTEPDEDITRYCGACGSPVGYEVLETPGIEYVQYNYCPECGRSVKWDG